MNDLTRARAWIVVAYTLSMVIALLAGRMVGDQHPLLVAGVADGLATLVVFFFSMGLNNSSVYDPYWSLAPIPIGLYWMGQQTSVRAIVVMLLIGLWGARLTANWWLRWKGLTDEDFRYVEIREKTGRWYWPASLAGIHLLPTFWVFLGLLAVYPGLATTGMTWNMLDGLAILVAATAIAIEWLADRQLRRHIRSGKASAEPLSSGLWACSRHPNYFGEVLFWWGLFLFGLAANPGWWWSALGPLAMTCLFVFVSVPWMDRRLASGRPAYRDLMRTIPGLVPWRLGRNRPGNTFSDGNTT